MEALTSFAPKLPAAGVSAPARRAGDRAAAWHGDLPGLVPLCYLLAAVLLTWRLWADPASLMVGGNPHDADLFAWFMRYAATAVRHGRLPALVTDRDERAGRREPDVEHADAAAWRAACPGDLAVRPAVSLAVLTTAGFAGSAAGTVLGAAPLGRQPGRGSAGGRDLRVLPGAAAGGRGSLQPPAGHPAAADHRCWPPDRHRTAAASIRRSGDGSLPERRRGRAGWRAALASLAGLAGSAPLAAMVGVAGEDSGFSARRRMARPAGCRARSSSRKRSLYRPRWLASCWCWCWLPPGPGIARPGTARCGRLADGRAGDACAGRARVAVQFHGPLAQHGAVYPLDYYVNDVTSFVTPQSLAALPHGGVGCGAASYQGGAAEYLAYLGWPLLRCWCWPPPSPGAARSAGPQRFTFAVLCRAVAGRAPVARPHGASGVACPGTGSRKYLSLSAALPDRLSILADGMAASCWRSGSTRPGPGSRRKERAAGGRRTAGQERPGGQERAPRLERGGRQGTRGRPGGGCQPAAGGRPRGAGCPPGASRRSRPPSWHAAAGPRR